MWEAKISKIQDSGNGLVFLLEEADEL